MLDNEVRVVKQVKHGSLVMLARRGEIQLYKYPGTWGATTDAGLTVESPRERTDDVLRTEFLPVL